MSHHPPLHPDESEPIALNPLLRGVDLAIDRLIRRNCFTGRTLDILDELREELLAVSSDTRPQGNPEMTLDDLRKIAEAATPGPWERDGAEIGQPFTCPEPWETVVSNEVECGAFCLGGVARGIAKGADAEFIATFNPQRVLEMIDTLRGAEIRLDHAKTVIDRLQTRLAAVEKLHEREEIDYCDDPECCDLTPTCTDCAVNWPCPTIRAIKETQND